MRRVHLSWPRTRTVGVALVAAVAIGAVALAAVAVGIVRESYPDYDGTQRIEGLSAPVTVHRDGHGIPQVYAKTADDLFRAQGYLHAQDRFWEMDFRRHVTAGRVAELFGADQVETDAYLRTMGWRRVAEQEWQLVAPRTRQYLQAYADGVNEWLSYHDGGGASLEYRLLGLQNAGYEIEPWHPVDSLAWLKAMAWDLRGNMTAEITRAALLAAGLSRAQVEDLYPGYPYDRNQPIVTGTGTGAAAGTGGGSPVGADLDPGALDALAAGLARLPAMVGRGDGIGSNSWVIGGALTASGRPILANDPHLSQTMPGIWHQMGLHCEAPDPACPFDVAGFTFSGVPGVVIGHNARIGWGFTNLDPDVTDLYLERLDGDRYQVGDRWLPLQTRQETLKVAGDDDVTITVRTSKHGPLLSDASAELRDIGADPPVNAGGTPYAIALSWTALQPGRTADALFALNTAADWTTFRAAAAQFEVPAQNIVYADVDGNIGYQAPGTVPIRGSGDGRWMAPGWDPAYDWTGYVPFAQLPSSYNPPDGYLVTANQAVVGPQYPHLLTRDWGYGYRSQRIHELIAGGQAAGKITVADVQRMQFDNRNGFAPTLVPALRAAAGATPPDALRLLVDWDFQQPADGPTGSAEGRRSAAAAYYNAVWRHLLARTFDELPADYRPDGGDRWYEVVRPLLADAGAAWWDEKSTPARESRDQILRAALHAAAQELRRDQGYLPADWRWGRMHALTLENQTFGTSGIAPVEWLFNHGPAAASGGGAIVNATGWNAADGYAVTAVPSMRMIVDLSNLDASRWIQLTGNSGHAFHPNYHDQFERWRIGETLPWRWDRTAIADEAEHTLTLQ